MAPISYTAPNPSRIYRSTKFNQHQSHTAGELMGGQNSIALGGDSLLRTMIAVPTFAVEEEDGEIYDIEVGDWGIKASGE